MRIATIFAPCAIGLRHFFASQSQEQRQNGIYETNIKTATPQRLASKNKEQPQAYKGWYFFAPPPVWDQPISSMQRHAILSKFDRKH